MGSYTMSQVETLTDIKSHTLRVWERRYNFLKPSRTATNIRFYSDEEVRKLLNISILLNNGYRISKINNLGEDEFHDLILNLKSNYSDKFEDDINRLILYMIDMDEGFLELAGKDLTSSFHILFVSIRPAAHNFFQGGFVFLYGFGAGFALFLGHFASIGKTVLHLEDELVEFFLGKQLLDVAAQQRDDGFAKALHRVVHALLPFDNACLELVRGEFLD